ncbi:MAG: FKBP-type peptidyl-prolyl cis-trans isomerase [Lachnospiraceae bacterium]|nr:FKBP-type peptidyl-prolyl cis-trans isomerase [Lachnospiraceae bacterium]
MKIAVTYNNGEIFEHFGHSEEFKVYEVEDKKVISSTLVKADGQGHGALASLLGNENVDVLICGGIGAGAAAALSEQGIEVCAGQSGNTDAAVEAFLNGQLVDSGVNCDHHSHDEEEGCGSSCGSSCGGCGGGCGGCHQPSFDGKNVGKKVRAHYRGTLNDGTQFDSSYDRGEPLEFVCGAGMMIEGFDKAVANMEVGDIVDVHLMPEEAYGPSDPDAIFTVSFAELPGSDELEVGQKVYLQNIYGQPFPASVVAKDDKSVTFDANHEMAGKELNFRIELVEVL